METQDDAPRLRRKEPQLYETWVARSAIRQDPDEPFPFTRKIDHAVAIGAWVICTFTVVYFAWNIIVWATRP